jgi:2',3'-cyclic-nucleotide 2'-phosphodiesterase (5'-nucleotidase family)
VEGQPDWQPGRTLSLILSAETRGELLPCGHCGHAGGIARRAAVIRACRDTADFVIAAEGGDIFRPGEPDPQLDAFLVRILAQLQYSVLGVGDEDLRRGVPYLRELVAAHPGLEWVSANILAADTGKPIFAPYVLRRAGPHVIGFTSCLDPALWKEFAPSAPGVTVADPVERMGEVLASMRKECQLVVCFVHMDLKPLRKLLTLVEGIDIAVDSHGPRVEAYAERVGRARHVFFAGPQGRLINWADVELLPEGPALRASRTIILHGGADEDSTVAREVMSFLGTREAIPSEPEDERETPRGEAQDNESESEDLERESGDPRAAAQEKPAESGRPR